MSENSILNVAQPTAQTYQSNISVSTSSTKQYDDQTNQIFDLISQLNNTLITTATDEKKAGEMSGDLTQRIEPLTISPNSLSSSSSASSSSATETVVCNKQVNIGC